MYGDARIGSKSLWARFEVRCGFPWFSRSGSSVLHPCSSFVFLTTVVGLAAALACRRSLPDHGGIKPDRQRAAALERFVVGGPVPGLVGGACGFAHAAQLPHWIHEMNPSRVLCNRAAWLRLRLLVSKPSYQQIIPTKDGTHGDASGSMGTQYRGNPLFLSGLPSIWDAWG